MASLLISPGPVTTVTLNRPDVRNALDEGLIAELNAWARQVPADGSVRVAVLAGAGPVFCAGADLAWMRRASTFTRDENIADARSAAEMFLALDSLPVPLIGRVQGAAIGGGVGLAAICDTVVATEDARFVLPETRLGLVPAMISPYLIRKIGLSAARMCGLSGEPFTAQQAATMGLVHHVVPAEQLDVAVERAVAAFSQAAPSAVVATKRLFAAITGSQPADVMAITAEAIADARMSPEGREGLRAFFEKRAPVWATPLQDTSTRRS
jgi:methylglutaconyl-CoA hydratase